MYAHVFLENFSLKCEKAVISLASHLAAALIGNETGPSRMRDGGRRVAKQTGAQNEND